MMLMIWGAAAGLMNGGWVDGAGGGGAGRGGGHTLRALRWWARRDRCVEEAVAIVVVVVVKKYRAEKEGKGKQRNRRARQADR
jgi:hypothetical protein